MTETTNTTKHIVLDERSESEKSIAADIALIVESAAKEKTPKNAPIVDVKPLVTKDYVDPQDKDYVVEKQNLIGTGLDRNTDEGRSVIHQTIHLMGDQAEY